MFLYLFLNHLFYTLPGDIFLNHNIYSHAKRLNFNNIRKTYPSSRTLNISNKYMLQTIKYTDKNYLLVFTVLISISLHLTLKTNNTTIDIN
jgi:hypothetical protein